MQIIKNYIEYLKDNPEHLWFKRKLYGWGWTPVRWQGWVVVFTYIILVLILARTVSDDSKGSEIILNFLLPIILLTVVLIRVCYKTGEKPRWQWGLPKK